MDSEPLIHRRHEDGHGRVTVLLSTAIVLLILALAISYGNLHATATGVWEVIHERGHQLWDWLVHPFMSHPDHT